MENVETAPATFAPGIHNITNEEYHADTSHISCSGIKKIRRSPAHYWQHYLNPNREPEEQKEAFVFGSAVHCAVLEPERFKTAYTFFNDLAIINQIGGAAPRQTKAYKEWKAVYESENADKIILSAKTYAQVLLIQKAVRENPDAAQLLANGKAEQSMFFTDPETGAPCKIQPDWETELGGGVWLVDLKTAENASLHEFGRASLNYGYDIQPPFYCDGYEQVTGIKPEGFVFIAVEKEAPFNVAVYFVEENVMGLGRRKYKDALKTYQECRASGIWPGYGEGAKPLTLPAYAFN